MLELKCFEERHKIAENLENQFLRIYFGTNPAIVEFAKKLISTGNKEAAKALNKAVKCFGEKINPSVVISVIDRTYAKT